MLLSRFVMLCVGTVALSACGDDDVTAPDLPLLSEVRFINALSDTGGVDIRAMDQVTLSPEANNLGYRAGTQYFPTEAGVRHLRVFPASTDIDVTSQTMADAMLTLPVGRRLTVILTGSARAATARLWVLDDAATPPPAGQIGIRLVNASGGLVNGYVVNSATDPLPASTTFSNVAAFAPSPYVYRPAGPAAIHVTDVGTALINASSDGPAAPATLPGQKPAAGVDSEGTVFTVYYFPPGAPGSANATVTSPTVIWFVDRNPCDDPPVAGCGQ